MITSRMSATAMVLLCATYVPAQLNFAPAVHYGGLSDPSGLTHADFDGDGHLDLATTSDANDRAVVFRNAGGGTFGTSFPVFLPAGSSPQDLLAADFEGDGDADLAIALRDPAGNVQVMLNDGMGNFSFGSTTAVGDRPRGMSVADLGTGPSLAVANRDSNSLSVLRNDGFGGLASMTVGVGVEPRDTTFGNFLAGPGLEIAISNQDDRTITILSDAGAGYAPVQTLNVGAAVRPDGVTTADFNDDGLDDLAVAVGAPEFAAVYLNTGGGFAPAVNYPTGGLAGSDIHAADFNCDGFADLVVSNTDSHNVSVFTNQGDGTFAASQLFSVGNEPNDVSIGDWDGDGDVDLAVENDLSNSISVLINNTCSIVVDGDFNDDGLHNGSDIDALVAEIAGGMNTTRFDLTGDGVVDAADLNAWLAEAGAINLPSGAAYLVGDANLDGRVDGGDFLLWNAHKFTTVAQWTLGDFTADGVVDGGDFVQWNLNKFASADGIQAVPEAFPTILSWLGFAVVGGLARQRR